MILELKEEIELCEWLINKGLSLCEAAHVLSNLCCGDKFSLALLKVVIHKKVMKEKNDEKKPYSDWGNPITP